MTRSNRRKAVLGVAGAGGVLAVALAVPNLAFAENTSAAPSASVSASAKADSKAADREARQAARLDELATALAKELNVDKEKVAAALAKIESAEAAHRPTPGGTARPDRSAELKARLATAVAAGKLTQAEADAILKAAAAGVLLGGGPGGGHAPGK